MSESDPPAQALLAEILAWYVEAGVDLAVEESAPDRLAEEETVAVPAPSRPSAPPLQREATPAAPALRAAAAAPDEAAMAARELARSAPDLAALEACLERFEGCGLKQTARRLVFADGTPGARLMIVGEAPGSEEDEVGRPFVGRAGRLLDLMLAAIGLTRTDAYIANVVPWRPPGNRTPTPQETAICLPFIRRQVELCAPEVLLCLGAPATQALLEQREGILRLRGRWFSYAAGPHSIAALPSLHPAYLLRQPSQKRLAWRDWRALAERLGPKPERN